MTTTKETNALKMLHSEINDKIDFIGIWQFFYFLVKKYFTSPLSYISLIIPTILITVLPITMPANMIYTGVLSISLIRTTFLFFLSDITTLSTSHQTIHYM